MALARTEMHHDRAGGLDARPAREILEILADGQAAAVATVGDAIDALAEAAGGAAHTLNASGRLVYVGAGSSGLIAMTDGLELPGTFGIPAEQVLVLIAGGVGSLARLEGASEDDAERGTADLSEAGIGAGDCVIGVSASGTTPYTVAAVGAARAAGALTIGLANNAGAPLLAAADIAVHLPTPPEVVAGSTRMGAGTAQKVALNMFSTLVAVEMGHLHDGYMINVVPDNAKLKNRAARMVADIAGCTETDARALLERAGGSVKTAVLLASGVPTAEGAADLLRTAQGRLRDALELVETSNRSDEADAR